METGCRLSPGSSEEACCVTEETERLTGEESLRPRIFAFDSGVLVGLEHALMLDRLTVRASCSTQALVRAPLCAPIPIFKTVCAYFKILVTV